MDEANWCESAGQLPIDGSDIGYAVEKLALGRRPRAPTVREQLDERIKGLETQLAAHRAALAVLDETPGVERVLDALRKIGV